MPDVNDAGYPEEEEVESEERRMAELEKLGLPDTNKPAAAILPFWKENAEQGLCTTCGARIHASRFMNDISKKEYSISGMCQDCQDKTFEQARTDNMQGGFGGDENAPEQ